MGDIKIEDARLRKTKKSLMCFRTGKARGGWKSIIMSKNIGQAKKITCGALRGEHHPRKDRY
jgi:hypothetical protein